MYQTILLMYYPLYTNIFVVSYRTDESICWKRLFNDFYYLSRSILVKDEKHYDKFDRAFDIYFKGLETLDDVIQAMIPDEWLRKEFEKFLTEEELKKIKTMGGLEKLLEEFK